MNDIDHNLESQEGSESGAKRSEGLSYLPYRTAPEIPMKIDTLTGEIIELPIEIDVYAGMSKARFLGQKDSQKRMRDEIFEEGTDGIFEEGIDDTGEKPKRGKVQGMSRRSRKRMIEAVSKIRNLEKSFFITLTYPDIFPDDMAIVKRDFKVFIQRLLRAYPDCGYIWRLEYKARKSGENKGKVAPHFHIILLEQTDKFELRSWLAKNWHEVIGTNDPKHLVAGTQCDRVRSRRGAMKYTSKYLSKVDEVEIPLGGGRSWGEGGKLDRTPYTTLQLTFRQWIDLRRLIAQRRPDKKNVRKRGYDIRIVRPSFDVSLLGLGLDDDNTFLQQALRAIGFKPD